MPVSPLAKENGAAPQNGSNKKHKNFEAEDNDESDMAKDEDSDENNPPEPVNIG